MSSLIHKTSPLGFTLIEVMIVVIIIALMSTLGITNYLSFMEDNQVRVSTQDVQVFLRDIQNRAKMGDRGTGICAAVSGNTVLNRTFIGWGIKLGFDDASNFTGTVQAKPTCNGGTGASETLTLPAHIKVTGLPSDLRYPALYQNPDTNGSDITIYTYDDRDKTLCYRFVVTPGGGMTKPEKSTWCQTNAP